MKWVTQLEVLQVEGGKWQLAAPLVYASDIYEVGMIEVPEGFITDFASVPRLPVIYTLFGGRANGPAVLHDYGYQTGKWPRAIVDRLFREAMGCDGMWMSKWFMWLGVRLFGGSHYNDTQPPQYNESAFSA